MSVEGSATPSAAVLAEASGAQPVVADGQPVAQAPEQAPVKPQDDKFAAKFAALARKEKELRDSQGKFLSERQRLEQERAEMEAWKTEQKTAKDALLNEIKGNPLKWLQENAGYDFEALTQMQLNEQNPTPEMLIKRTREELESGYKRELEELKNAMREKEEQKEKAQFEQTVSGFKEQISSFIDSNADAYELIKMNDAQELVFEVIQEFYESSGKVLSIEEAAKHTEEHLESEARKVFEAKKFKQTSQKQSEESPKQTAPTLSNTLAAEVPVTGKKKLSREESLAQAAKMIRWNE
jgi:hypothetical protein